MWSISWLKRWVASDLFALSKFILLLTGAKKLGLSWLSKHEIGELLSYQHDRLLIVTLLIKRISISLHGCSLRAVILTFKSALTCIIRQSIPLRVTWVFVAVEKLSLWLLFFLLILILFKAYHRFATITIRLLEILLFLFWLNRVRKLFYSLLKVTDWIH